MSTIDEADMPPRTCPVCGGVLVVADDPSDPGSVLVMHGAPECDGFARFMAAQGATLAADNPGGDPS